MASDRDGQGANGPVDGLISHRLNAALGRVFPERYVFLRSDAETGFLRLRPTSQALILSGAALTVLWGIFATAILLVGAMSAGDARQQAMLEQANYEARLNALSHERDARARETVSAEARFNKALNQVSAMQSELLTSDDHLHELETGIAIVQKMLGRAIKERDANRSEVSRLRARLAHATGANHTVAGRAQDMAATLGAVTAQLARTAAARDVDLTKASVAEAAARKAQLDAKLLEQHNTLTFDKLDRSLSIAKAPLTKTFRSIGLDPRRVIADIRAGFDISMGGPFVPIVLSAQSHRGALDVKRANDILASLRELKDYRIAEQHIPLGLPLKTRFTYTSPYGYRRNPFTGGSDFHPGIDMAGAYGSPIYATSNGIIRIAGWYGGYGRMVEIQDAFGIQTIYGHLSQIRVKVGERVKRGQRIGDMGSTGHSTGTHLHYEIRVGGHHVDPVPFMKVLDHPTQARRVASFEIRREGRLVK